MPYSQSWLEDPAAIRIVLVVAKAYDILASQEVTFYFSNSGYVTTDGYTFDPVIAGDVGLQESLALDDSQGTMTFGDIELYNLNGELDNLLDTAKYRWTNQQITMYFGDPGWTSTLANLSTNFLTVFNGLISDIDSRTLGRINLKVRDKLERLNAPISENKIGTYGTWADGQQNKDQLRPIVLGECFNITPVLINPALLEYCFSTSNPDQVSDATQASGVFTANGASEKLIEIRDNGIPIYILGNSNYQGATVDLATSTFKLTRSPVGTITCSVQGVQKSMTLATGAIVSTYSNTIPGIVGMLVQQFGKSTTRFSSSDLDLQTFQDFNQTAEIGCYISENKSVLQVCQELANSVGGQIVMSRTGKLRLVQFGVSLNVSIAPSVAITVDDMLYDSLSISNRLDISAAIKIAYGKNYTVQPNLTSLIPDNHKLSFATEWYTTTQRDSTVATNYKLETDPIQKETELISLTDADAEATRLLNYYKTQKIIYKFIGTAKLLSLVLGQQVSLTHHRFGLNNGKTGQVISLAPSWTRDQVEVEVIV